MIRILNRRVHRILCAAPQSLWENPTLPRNWPSPGSIQHLHRDDVRGLPVGVIYGNFHYGLCLHLGDHEESNMDDWGESVSTVDRFYIFLDPQSHVSDAAEESNEIEGAEPAYVFPTCLIL